MKNGASKGGSGGGGDRGAGGDHVDSVIAQWERERPGLDYSVMALVARLALVYRLGAARVETNLKAHGLGTPEFDVLATLRRSGDPYRLSPTALSRWLMLSSGAMTNRLDRLEQASLIRRVPDPDDRRGIQVELTANGRELLDAALPAHIETEAAVLGGLTKKERRELDRLLRKLLAGMDGA